VKNQYFGDVNDYVKYGLLRVLAEGGKLKIGVCWMLTDTDATAHGNYIRYLKERSKWQQYDPNLFACLDECVTRGVRDVSEAERLALVPAATYFNGLLTSAPGERHAYFMRMLEKFTDRDLIFFDPDNGIEVRSVKFGNKNSNKYLFSQELCDAFARGHSVLLYQHFPREERTAFISRLTDQIQKRTGADEIHSFRTANVVLCLIPQEKHKEVLRGPIGRIKEKWDGKINVTSIPTA
jgi:hypothetical protein